MVMFINYITHIRCIMLIYEISCNCIEIIYQRKVTPRQDEHGDKVTVKGFRKYANVYTRLITFHPLRKELVKKNIK